MSVTQTQTSVITDASQGDGLPYLPNPALYDEAVDANGEYRPHWENILERLKELGPEAFADRESKALRILRDDGATYNIYSEPGSPAHIWNMDLIPMVLGSNEWGTIEAGLLERAELFNLLLRDIYGKRDLIRLGVIPPEALFGHRGFLRPCQGIQIPGEHDLILHSVDLARSPDGTVMAIGDRTQNPSGWGYSLENRNVMSRVFPSLFRDSEVHRLSTFFQRLRAKLNSLSRSNNPRVAVLTPGAHNETYFEHAYLANYLGFHLVQSDDLVVRNGFLWMKSLDGLSRVDVLLRRVDDWFCDPVELRGDSRLGVASLLDVVRSGNLVVANPLGSGILENPVLLRYMPEIGRQLLGRDLRLASVKTWWCGLPEDLSYVLEHLDQLVIKPVYRSLDNPSKYGPELSQQELQQLRQQLLTNGAQYVAQPILEASHVPTFVNGEMKPRPAILRSFAVANNSSYTVMPGGLTRIGVEEKSFMISNQTGSKSKDTWVIASEPEADFVEEHIEEPISREADLISLPSRVVENLFWMGRYAERAESSLRILRTAFIMLNGEERISEATRHQLLHAVSMLTATPSRSTDFQTAEEALRGIIENGAVMNSISGNLNAMLYCANETKELLSSDTFRVINDIRDALATLDTTFSSSLASAPEETLDPLVTALMALSGLTQESMIRGFGWRFMDMGRRLERGYQIAITINSLLVPAMVESDQSKVCEALLLSLEALISYRRRYRARVGVMASLDLVMMDGSNPRSLVYQIEQLSNHIRALPKAPSQMHELAAEERRMLECETTLKLSSLSDLNKINDAGLRRDYLDQQVSKIADLLSGMSDLITDKYFDHREASQQLVRNNWESF
ncbi:circularly permuted type 2 ATP-grasp protein [Oceanobacter mangrovi]|uniref:circularly permuted type 2 ATP-grasp protein n=1 Tax=Oceanobacter mangrovi TaxID=2862510 RepID=UPI001C8D01EC|nr:circularly permuted type 2 ATP-grasp protein [Oceanobacter mangrovi]